MGRQRDVGRMARRARIEYGGAFYHVMARGNRREAIFLDDDDMRFFLQALSEACEKTAWRVHAWVLMGNHYHLFIETPEANLVEGMKWLQNTVTRRFNIRHRQMGAALWRSLQSGDRGGGTPGVLRNIDELHPFESRAGGIGECGERREHPGLPLEQRGGGLCRATWKTSEGARGGNGNAGAGICRYRSGKAGIGELSGPSDFGGGREKRGGYSGGGGGSANE